jgi:hypothetical protein
VPGLPALPGVPALPALPELPVAVDQQIATPVGNVDVYADSAGVDACADLATPTAVPPLPVPLPVPVPLPAIPAGAQQHLCADASLGGADIESATYAQTPAGSAQAGLDATADAGHVEGGFWADVAGAFKAAGDFFAGLF